MTQEQKELLLKDLCSRLPYGVKVNEDIQGDFTLIGLTNERVFTTCEVEACHNDFPIERIKPYLFPLSSMTDDQEEELKNIYYSFNGMFQYTERIFDKIPFRKMKYFPYQIEEFFNKNHIDYRGLIPKGLAKDATNLNVY
jgi:hypothetical protein